MRRPIRLKSKVLRVSIPIACVLTTFSGRDREEVVRFIEPAASQHADEEKKEVERERG